MLVLRDPALAGSIADPDVRRLVMQRFAQVLAGEAYDYDRHGYMVVVEPGDSVFLLEQTHGCPILQEPYDDTRYGEPDFSPSFDHLEEHKDGQRTICFEMLFITNDDGFGITFFIPKADGIPGNLLAMCAEYAQSAKVDGA